MAKRQTVTVYTVIERLELLALPKDCGIEVFAPAVIDCFRYSDCFQEFDANCDRFDSFCGNRAWMVRRVRNHEIWGPMLSEANAAKRPRVARVVS